MLLLKNENEMLKKSRTSTSIQHTLRISHGNSTDKKEILGEKLYEHLIFINRFQLKWDYCWVRQSHIINSEINCKQQFS